VNERWTDDEEYAQVEDTTNDGKRAPTKVELDAHQIEMERRYDTQ
jgi:hypothetical protein